MYEKDKVEMNKVFPNRSDSGPKSFSEFPRVALSCPENSALLFWRVIGEIRKASSSSIEKWLKKYLRG